MLLMNGPVMKLRETTLAPKQITLAILAIYQKRSSIKSGPKYVDNINTDSFI